MELSTYIKQSAQNKKICCMAHVICGYPSMEANLEILDAIDKSGIELVEIQFPFSDPIADGPTFTVANQYSLEKGTTVEDCFNLMKLANEEFSFKILMMGYYNTVFCYGEERFCERLEECGAVGMIIPDIPVDEAVSLKEFCQKHGLSFIPLIAPVTPVSDYQYILKDTTGFVYVVSRKGVTGKDTDFERGTQKYFKKIKEYSNIPIGVGFGIKSRKDVAFLEDKADIAIIGTAILTTYFKEGQKGVRLFLSSLREI